MQTFNDLLFTRSNSKWLLPHFFSINLFSLVNAGAVLVTDHTVKLTDKETVNRPVFDEVGVRLSDAAHRNMNQKYVLFWKNTSFRWTVDVNIVRCHTF